MADEIIGIAPSANDQDGKTKNGIRRARLRSGLSQKEAAAATGLDLTAYKRIEQGWDAPEPWLVSDLAILFETNAANVLGREITVEEWRRSPHAAGHIEAAIRPYGNLTIEIAGKERSYPVSVESYESLIRQLLDRRPGDYVTQDDWLSCATLDNKLTFINPRHLRRLALNSDDDEQMDVFAHPEVYRALNMYEPDDNSMGPVLQKAVTEWLDQVGEEAATAQVCQLYVLYSDGSELGTERYLSDHEVTTDIFALDANSFSINQNTMLKVSACGYHVHEFINLSHVALLEAPLERYLRYSAPE